MKRIFLSTLILLTSSLALFAQPTGNIRFTITKNPSQENQVLIKAKNFSGSTISGIIGASNITLCVLYPRTLTGLDIQISSPIAGQTFDNPLKNALGTDSIISWNGLGFTSAVSFPSNTEVTVAAVTFNGGAPGATSTIKLGALANSGPSGFDYCYIAPGGVEHSGYSTPFYSNIASDPLLINSGGPNDAPTMNTSTVGIGSVALPVKFLSFYAIKNGDNAKLNWTVESDENNKFFDVERSTDGRNFKPHAKVDAKGNGKSINTYETSDFNLSKVGSPVIYYRIKQVDKNGEITFSNIRNLNADRNGPPASLYPNPVKNTTRLVIDADGPGKASLVVRDIHGKLVKQINIQLIKGFNQHDLNVAELASGEYNVSVVGEGFAHQLKMTKIN